MTFKLFVCAVTIIVTYGFVPAQGFICQKPTLELRITPYENNVQVTWKVEKFNVHDWVGIYGFQTDTRDSDLNLLHRIPVEGNEGWKISTTVFAHKIKRDFKKAANLGYRAVYWRKNNKDEFKNHDEAVVTTTLSTYPNWMSYYWDKLHLGERRLSEIFLPGSHDALCREYMNPVICSKTDEIKEAKESGEDKMLMIKAKLGGLTTASGSDGSLSSPFSSSEELEVKCKKGYTQETTILEQLLMGIRYLDFSVDLQGEKYVAGINAPKGVNLDKALRDIVRFTHNTEKEIVILDFHTFGRGIHSQEQHEHFINYLKKQFTAEDRKLYIEPVVDGWNLPLKNLLEKGKVIISYNAEHVVNTNNHGILWPPVTQHYDNDGKSLTDSITFLKNYFNEVSSGRHHDCHHLQAAVVRMTERGNGMKFNVLKTDRHLKKDFHVHVRDVHHMYWDKKVGEHTSVLSTDHFIAMGTVRHALTWNTRKFLASYTGCDAHPSAGGDDQYYQHNIIDTDAPY